MLLQTCLAAAGAPGGFAVDDVPLVAVDPTAGNAWLLLASILSQTFRRS